jgi:radical SAM protein
MTTTTKTTSPPAYSREDFDHSPMIAFYEVTRACDLACKHCRADAQRSRDPAELTLSEAKRLIDQLTRFCKPPLLVLAGGDPLKRADVFDMIGHARRIGLTVALTPSATPLATEAALRRLNDAGLHRLALSLDGAYAATHDGFRGVPGSYLRTLEILADARAVGMPVQVNTTVARHNVGELDAIAQLLARQDIVLWSVFFLVPTGRAQIDQRLSAEEVETVFERLWRHQATQPYAIKTTEAPHYRRFILQQAASARAAGAAGQPPRRMTSRTAGTNDGKGILFVSQVGEIYPSGFLPIACGRFPFESVLRVYQASRLFRSLRDADGLCGKCGTCEYRHICGGSRARAYAVSGGDPLASEPDCAYVPPGWPERGG